MIKEKQILPKWFNGSLYKNGNNVRNIFSNKSYKLNAKELSMYDFIKGCEYVLDVRGYDKKVIILMQKGLAWLKKNNSKAYTVLLD